MEKERIKSKFLFLSKYNLADKDKYILIEKMYQLSNAYFTEYIEKINKN